MIFEQSKEKRWREISHTEKDEEDRIDWQDRSCVSESAVLPVVLNCSSVLLCKSCSSGAEGKWPSRHR